MKDFLKRLTSRKFLLALAASLTFYANGQYTELAATVIAYLGAEGYIDGKREKAQTNAAPQSLGTPTTYTPSEPDDDGVDRSAIVAGV